MAADRGYGSPCWLWRRAKTGGGYGQVWIDGKALYTHRVYYERAKGPIPAGLELDHLCRVPACCNPDHLEPVTHFENAQRGVRRKKTHCPQGHPYDEFNTGVRRNGHRVCMTCQRESKKRRREERKAA